MAVTHANVSVGTTATLLSSAASGRDGQTLSIQNPTGGANVFLGGSTVTSSAYGFLLAAATTFTIELQDGEAIYGIVASSTQTVNVLRQGT